MVLLVVLVAYLPVLGQWPVGAYTTAKSVTQSQCDARPSLTFQVTGHPYPLVGTKLYFLVTERPVFHILNCVESHYVKWNAWYSTDRITIAITFV